MHANASHVLSRRLAYACAALAAVLHTIRCALWGRWPDSPAQWIIAADAYVAAALLVFAAVLAGRSLRTSMLLSGAWGFACGLLYRSLFEQLHDPTRQSGHEVIVIAVKTAALLIAVVGLVTSALPLRAEVRQAQ